MNNEEIENFFKISLDKANTTNIKLYIEENRFTKKNEKIGEYIVNEVKRPIISPLYGKVVKVDLEEGIIIIERCKHEERYFNLCTACSHDKR